MGEVADSMISGEACEGCGVWLEGGATGHPRRCFGCGGKARDATAAKPKKSKAKPFDHVLYWSNNQALQGGKRLSEGDGGDRVVRQLRSQRDADAAAGSSKCRGCGASLVWAKTPSGKNQPFDAKVETKGMLMQQEDGTIRVEFVRVLTPHHATCPNADEFRRRR